MKDDTFFSLFDIGERGNINANQMHPITLAFLGDVVHLFYVRSTLISKADFKQRDLQVKASKVVRATNQAKALDIILDKLTSDEQDIARRARNAKTNNIAKNASPEEYKKSTAFEALLGYFYLTKNGEKLKLLLDSADECALKK